MADNQVSRVRRKLILVIISPIIVVLLISIIAGYFAPLQESRVVEFGICTQATEVEPVVEIPKGTEILWICGTLEGKTKRYLSFNIFYQEQGVYYRGGNFNPGLFFIPVEANDLHFISASQFKEGAYRVTFAYARDAVKTIPFSVAQ